VSVRGIGWYTGAFVALIASAAALGFFGLSFFSSFTPLYVSIVCSVVAIMCGVVAVVLARSDGASRTERARQPAEDAELPLDATARPEEQAGRPAEAVQPGDAE